MEPEQCTLDDIRSLIFYLEYYLESIQYQRKMQKHQSAKKGGN